ncbi:hypothetical protein [Halochromatium salexigens]|uniref:Uncharacterized protein n=1 Tax=Halochromatium salexigens TaxID=49447 RepID=A0AAJ0XFJ3_HALSE|nr:hypothetical protein [Halochromatium salexigens]MBK5929747.1 hypothetical protein [Halochromatium salexigens]
MAFGDDAHSGSNAEGGLWPSADYQAQVERLRAAVGEPIYLAELRETDIQLGVVLGQVLGRSAAAAQSQLESAPAPAPPAAGATAQARDHSPLVDEDD